MSSAPPQTIASSPSATPLIRPPPVQTGAAQDASSLDLVWRVVALANLYRLLLPPVLFTVHMFTRPAPSVGGTNPQLFMIVCVVYWVMGGLFAFGGRGHWPNRRIMVVAHTLLDSTAVAVLLYCSGGAGSGLGILLVIPVGAMALLAEGRTAFANAAIAALAILAQQIFSAA